MQLEEVRMSCKGLTECRGKPCRRGNGGVTLRNQGIKRKQGEYVGICPKSPDKWWWSDLQC